MEQITKEGGIHSFLGFVYWFVFCAPLMELGHLISSSLVLGWDLIISSLALRPSDVTELYPWLSWVSGLHAF